MHTAAMSRELVLPPDLQHRLDNAMEPGERLCYVARPGIAAGVMQQIPLFLIALGWSAISFTLAYFVWATALGFMPISTKAGIGSQGLIWFMAILILPFVVIGLALFWAVAYALVRQVSTVHAVTDRRVLNVYGGRLPGVEIYTGQQISFTKRTEYPSGRGSLSIAYGVDRDADDTPHAVATTWSDIPDVRAAEEAVKAIMPGNRGKRG
jgi:hypothetical protein